MTSSLTVNLVVIDVEPDAQLLRLVIESYGGRVNLIPVALPSQLVEALSGQAGTGPAEHVLICGHGGPGPNDEPQILIPELAEDLYVGQPFRDMGPGHVRDLVHLDGEVVVSCPCSSGRPEMAAAFMAAGAGAGAFVGPISDEDGKSCLQFVVTLYYGLLAQGLSLSDAVEQARGFDDATGLFKLNTR
jgi:hypothetical protein